MKFTARTVFGITVILWILLCLPFFVPALNTLEPRILGIPFIVFYDFVLYAAHIALMFLAKRYAWDEFTADSQEGGADR